MVFVFLVFVSGCATEKQEVKKEPSINQEENVVEQKQEVIPIGMYVKQNGERVLTKEYSSLFALNQDVGVFSVFYTLEEKISGASIKDVWNSYLEKQPSSSLYKIGYHIFFETQDMSISQTILKPEDAYGFYDYMQVYLYDDIHQEDGAFYTHIEKMGETSLLTSIKLTGSTHTYEIVSPITLTAFLYQGNDDFGQNGMYKGTHMFSMVITKL